MTKPPTTGVVIMTHGFYGAALLKAARAIVGELPNVTAVAVASGEAAANVGALVERASDSVDRGRGILYLVDLHGSTPSNVCLNQLDGRREAEVLCGLNLAMLIKLATCERTEGPHALAELLRETGRKAIRLGSEGTGQVTLKDPVRR